MTQKKVEKNGWLLILDTNECKDIPVIGRSIASGVGREPSQGTL